MRTVDLPGRSRAAKELDAAVRFQAQDVIPMPLDQAVLDWQRRSSASRPPTVRVAAPVLLVAARRDMVERVVAAVRGAGLRLDGIDLGALAMIRALRGEGGPDNTAYYASVSGMTNLAVARGDLPLFARASGGGIEALAIELAERRTLTLDHARGWLQHVGMTASVESIEGDEQIVASTAGSWRRASQDRRRNPPDPGLPPDAGRRFARRPRRPHRRSRRCRGLRGGARRRARPARQRGPRRGAPSPKA